MKKILFVVVVLIKTLGIAQESKLDKRITDDACNCINKIDPKIKYEVKGDSISKCITMASIKVQVLQQMLSTDKNNKNIVIADKDFDEIQKYLFENCSGVKKLLMTNDEVGINTFSKSKEAKQFYDKGELQFKEGNYKKAIKNFEKAVEIDPNFAFAWDNLGISYRKIEKFDQAINCYKKSLEIDPKGHMPLLNLAVTYELLKNYKEASESYENFKLAYPDDAEGFYGVGRMKYLLGLNEESLDNLLGAYNIYKKINSPYIHDATQMLSFVYGELKKQNKKDFIKSMEDKYKVNFE